MLDRCAPHLVGLLTLVMAWPCADSAQATERVRFDLPDKPKAAASLNGGFAGVRDVSQVPYRYSGQLLVRFPRSPVGACTATVVDSPSRRLVLTAAHCLVDIAYCGRWRCAVSWPQWMKFVPARSPGLAPFGVFEGDEVFALRPYLRSLKRGWKNNNFDVGAVLVNGAVTDAVGGGAILAQNRSRNQEFEVLGYPGSRQRQMHRCEGVFSGDDRRSYRLPGPSALRVNCFMGEGASGGPWLIDGGTAINGVTSYGYPRDRFGTYGPYFSDRTVGQLVAGL